LTSAAFILIVALLYAVILRGFVKWRASIYGLATPALLWLALPVYDRWIRTHACSGDCGIRVDLVFIAPLLLLAAILAGLTAFTLVFRRGK
jgi:hypothetical protein